MTDPLLSASSQKPAAPRLSATVIVVRQSGHSGTDLRQLPEPRMSGAASLHAGDHGSLSMEHGIEREYSALAGYEVLLAKRAQTLRVLPGFMVFPGGVLEESDLDRARNWAENTSGEQEPLRTLPSAPDEFALSGGTVLSRSVTRNELYYSLLVGALRELFEETGLRILDSLDVSALSHIVGGGTTVRYFGRRVTPERVRYRFDTHYFVVEAPASAKEDLQLAESEFEMALWATPQDILSARDTGSYLLAPPTVDALSALCAYTSTETLLRHGVLPAQRDDDSRIDQFIAQTTKPLR